MWGGRMKKEQILEKVERKKEELRKKENVRLTRRNHENHCLKAYVCPDCGGDVKEVFYFWKSLNDRKKLKCLECRREFLSY